MVIKITDWLDKKLQKSLDETQELMEKGLAYTTTPEGSFKLEKAFKEERRYIRLYEKYAK